MLLDLSAAAALGRLEAAVCVIGSGAAGMSVALTLDEADVDVVLLEAGGRRAAADDALVGDLTGAPGHDPLERVRQRRLGGTTAQWGGRCVPLDPVDIEHRSWVPDSGWPIDADALRPWYRRAAELLRLGADEWTAADALGDAPRLFSSGAGPLTDDGLWRWSPPVRFWRTFGRRLETSPRLRVVADAQVVRLEQDRPGGPATTAVVALPGGGELPVRATTFVVAAGGVETARLLLASDRQTSGGIGGAAVGRYYMIHPLAEVGLVRVDPALDVRTAVDFTRSRDGVWVRRMLRLSDAAQREHQLRNAAFALWYPDPRDPAHRDGLLSSFALVRRALTRTGGFKATGIHRRYAEGGSTRAHVGNVARDLPAVARYGVRWTRERWLSERTLPSFASVNRQGLYRLRFDAEQSPEPGNRVVLSGERDAVGMPRAAVHHRVGRDDRESLVRSLQLVAAELARSGRATVELPPDEHLLDELVFGDGTHQIGTARMSSSPRTGVVDADCRVHDCANVFVAGSAVFPTGGMAGPTMTIVALALRLADRLGREAGVPVRAEQR